MPYYRHNFVGHEGSLRPSGVESGYLWSNSSYSFNKKTFIHQIDLFTTRVTSKR